MKVKASDVWGEVEEGLGSVGKIRILRLLMAEPEECFTKYMLERATGLKPKDVKKSLEVLVGLGWVVENPCDPKTYRINLENERVKILAELFCRLARQPPSPQRYVGK
ncbi:MAG: hypothetical protein QW506_06495 [Thermoproteota archaeon]